MGGIFIPHTSSQITLSHAGALAHWRLRCILQQAWRVELLTQYWRAWKLLFRPLLELLCVGRGSAMAVASRAHPPPLFP